MEFRFENKLRAVDIWKVSMYRVYHSMVGVCNIVFSVAVILLTVKIWNPREALLMSFLLICCILFPVIQPLMIYSRASGQVATLPEEMVYEINDTGVHITTELQKCHITWNRLRGVMKEYGMIILATEAGRGYMLTDKTLGAQKDSLLAFLEAKMEHK